MADSKNKFAADAMLGRLARWLRFLGCDVVYDSRLDDNAILFISLSEGRTLLTKDRELASRAKKSGYLVLGENTKAQVAEIVNKFDIEPAIAKERCPVCNGWIVAVPREEIRQEIPEYTSLIHSSFGRCESCGKVFWEGSHVSRAKHNLIEYLSSSDENK